MSDPTTYHRIVVKFASPFPRKGTTAQEWTLKFSLSGAALTSSSDAETTAHDLAQIALNFASSATSYIGWRYYPAGSSVNSYAGDYAIGLYPGTRYAYSDSSEGGDVQQLEVCCLAHCYVKQNRKGRPVYLMKHLHDVKGDGAGNIAGLAATPFGKWNTGCGPEELVPVDPTTGQSGTGWGARTALYTRQLRRGPKSKA